MLENRNTENPPLDCEDWQIAFQPYAGRPWSALILAYHLMKLTSYLRSKPKDIPAAAAAIDRAIVNLFPHSDFHQVGYKLYRLAVEGKITPEQENVIRQLGIRI